MEEVHPGRFHEASRMGADKARRAKPRVIPLLPVWPRRESAALGEVPEPALAGELWLYLRHLRDWVELGQSATTELFHAVSTDRVRVRGRARLVHWRPNSRRGRKRHPRRNHWAA
jgi:hypothetical protein